MSKITSSAITALEDEIDRLEAEVNSLTDALAKREKEIEELEDEIRGIASEVDD